MGFCGWERPRLVLSAPRNRQDLHLGLVGWCEKLGVTVGLANSNNRARRPVDGHVRETSYEEAKGAAWGVENVGIESTAMQ